jgi:hypothetical protein
VTIGDLQVTPSDRFVERKVFSFDAIERVGAPVS